jgi:hypothetical protein
MLQNSQVNNAEIEALRSQLAALQRKTFVVFEKVATARILNLYFDFYE